MDNEKDDPEQKANSSEEESDFESADEGENDENDKIATSADMRSDHSTSRDSRGGHPNEMASQESPEQSLTGKESEDSRVEDKNEETSMGTVENNTEIVQGPENPPEHGEAIEPESSRNENAPIETENANKQEKEMEESPVMVAGSRRERESSGEDETSKTNDSKDTKTSVEPDVAQNPREDQSAVKMDKKEQAAIQGGWGWGGWLSQATASVASGLTSVIETVETSLGVPDPNEMAKKVKEEEEELEKEQEDGQEGLCGDAAQAQSEGTGSFLSTFGVSSLTNVVQNRGMELVTGGLDALEFIGKRTMDVLSDGDSGLREKRVQLLSKGPTLSQVLREGKEASEAKATHRAGQENRHAPAVDVFTKFEEHQGMAHLEALEILSHESEAKVESQMIDLAAEDLNILKPVLRAVEQVFHIEDDDDDVDEDDSKFEEGDFESTIVENLSALSLNVRPDKLISTRNLGQEWLDACVQEQDTKPGSRAGQEIYEAAVGTMGELTARTVELFHKVAELIVFQGGKGCQTSALVRAQCLRKLTDTVSRESSSFATHFAGCLNTAANDAEYPDAISPLITNIYLDSSTCSSYLRNSCKLLCPVLQLSSLNENRKEQE